MKTMNKQWVFIILNECIYASQHSIQLHIIIKEFELGIADTNRLTEQAYEKRIEKKVRRNE